MFEKVEEYIDKILSVNIGFEIEITDEPLSGVTNVINTKGVMLEPRWIELTSHYDNPVMIYNDFSKLNHRDFTNKHVNSNFIINQDVLNSTFGADGYLLLNKNFALHTVISLQMEDDSMILIEGSSVVYMDKKVVYTNNEDRRFDKIHESSVSDQAYQFNECDFNNFVSLYMRQHLVLDVNEFLFLDENLGFDATTQSFSQAMMVKIEKLKDGNIDDSLKYDILRKYKKYIHNSNDNDILIDKA